MTLHSNSAAWDEMSTKRLNPLSLEKTMALRPGGDGPGDRKVKELHRALVKAQAFKGLSTDAGLHLVETFHRACLFGKELLVEVATSHQTVLSDRDGNGDRITTSLWMLANHHDAIAGRRLLRSILADIASGADRSAADPDEGILNALRSLIARANPAEYARLVARLAGPGAIAIARNGEPMRRSATSADAREVFQSSMAGYLAGRAPMDPAAFWTAEGFVVRAEIGMEALFGKRHRAVPTPRRGLVPGMMIAKLSRARPTLVGLRLDPSSPAITAAVVTGVEGGRVRFARWIDGRGAEAIPGHVDADAFERRIACIVAEEG
jgi:hypothetical protein